MRRILNQRTPSGFFTSGSKSCSGFRMMLENRRGGGGGGWVKKLGLLLFWSSLLKGGTMSKGTLVFQPTGFLCVCVFLDIYLFSTQGKPKRKAPVFGGAQMFDQSFLTVYASCWRDMGGTSLSPTETGARKGAMSWAKKHIWLWLCFWGTMLGPPVVPFYLFWGEGSPTKIDYGKSKIGHQVIPTSNHWRT